MAAPSSEHKALCRRNRHFQHDPRMADTTVRRRRLQLIERMDHRHRGAGHEQLDIVLVVRVDAFVGCRAIGQAQSKAVDFIATADVLAREVRALDDARQGLRLQAPGRDAFPPRFGREQAVLAFQAHAGPGTVEGEGLGLGDAAGVFCQGFGEGVDGFHQGRSSWKRSLNGYAGSRRHWRQLQNQAPDSRPWRRARRAKSATLRRR